MHREQQVRVQLQRDIGPYEVFTRGHDWIRARELDIPRVGIDGANLEGTSRVGLADEDSAASPGSGGRQFATDRRADGRSGGPDRRTTGRGEGQSARGHRRGAAPRNVASKRAQVEFEYADADRVESNSILFRHEHSQRRGICDPDAVHGQIQCIVRVHPDSR